MAKFQTEIQNEDAIRLGSCIVEVAPYDKTAPEYVELGAARNVKLAEQIEIATIAPDNTPPIRKVKEQTVVVSCEWMEPTLTGLAALRGRPTRLRALLERIRSRPAEKRISGTSPCG